MTRRRWLVLLAVGGGAVAIVIVVAASGVFDSGSPATASSDNGFPTSRATVRRQTISSQTPTSATLGYGDPSTIVAPSGTAPSAVAQAQQAVTAAQQQLAGARAAAAADATAFVQAKGAVAADRQKLTVDCAGDAGAAAAAAGSGSGSSPSPCASDAQTLAADQQSESQAAAKVATDAQSVSSASTGLAAANGSLATNRANETFYGQSSTFTQLPALGAIVRRGQVLYEIDGQPVVLLSGTVAAWRAFTPGMSPGGDVEALNANLRFLGYPAPAGDAFTSATAAAIAAFQVKLGRPATGELLLGSVVFEPRTVRVTSITPTVGAAVQPGAVLGITSTRRTVTIQLDAAEQTEVKVGDAVLVTLPDNSTTPGRVSYVGTVAITPSSSDQAGGGDSTPTIEVDVTLTHPAAAGRLDQAPVVVSITTETAKNVLVVPVDALLALASGGYALEVVDPDGTHHLEAAQTGLFDDQDGVVQVSGPSVAVGQKIVVPSE